MRYKKRRSAFGVALGFVGVVVTIVKHGRIAELRTEFLVRGGGLFAPYGPEEAGPEASDGVGNVSEWKLEAWNEHSRLNGLPGEGYPFLERGCLIEPWTPTDYVISGIPENAIFVRVNWSIENIATNEQVLNIQTSRPILEQHAVLSLGEFRVRAEVRQSSSESNLLDPFDNDIVQVIEKRMVSRYVRREIRGLNAMARTRFLDAAKILAETPTHLGQPFYGTKYRGLSDFIMIHLNAAAGRDTDHLHDGIGFLMQHTALTSDYETSLRAVDPLVSVPFWDFTYDKSVHTDLQSLYSESIWNDDFFGQAYGNINFTISSGRWAYQRVPIDLSTQFHNPYGYLRSPWNMQKSPFLTRCHSLGGVSPPYSMWPGCQAHYDLTFEYNSIYKYMWQAQAGPHGPVHLMLGGYLRTGPVFDDLATIIPTTAIGSTMTHLVTLIKALYRNMPHSPTQPSRHLNFPLACSTDTPQDQCHMICPDFVNDEHTVSNNDSLAPWLSLAEASNFKSDLQSAWRAHVPWIDSTELTTSHFARLLRWLCLTPFAPGDHMDAGSPNDISFWSIHPTLDRLLTYKRLVKPFPSHHWHNLEKSEATTEWCDAQTNSATSKCEGHHPWDLTKFKVHYYSGNFSDPASTGWTSEYLTISELYHYSDPHDYKLDYVYEHFVWQHCDELGLRFPSPATPHHQQNSHAIAQR